MNAFSTYWFAVQQYYNISMHREDVETFHTLSKILGITVNEGDLVLTPEQIREDAEEQKIRDSFVRRKCNQCGDLLAVCIWGYPVFKNLPSRHRIMGCLQSREDVGKNWWCDECETYFE